jgi:WD40 repeat protein
MAAAQSVAACPSPRELQAFRVGELPLPDLERVGEHLGMCPGCASTVDALLDTPDHLVAALRGLDGSDPVPTGGTIDKEMAALEAAWEDPSWRREPAPTVRVAAGPAPSQLREYRLLGKLGEGGMGAVYRALHTRLERVVALKVLAPERTADPDAVKRFQREMKAVGKLGHPHIVRATDAGEVDGTHFLVMEYVAGPDLARLVRAVGRLPVADACEAARQAAVGLHHAHQRGLVHRDVKPSNLLLSRTGQVKLLDLGLALLPKATEGTTSEDLVLGTLDYLAPEQAERAHAVDRRADVYGLGCTLYHLLAGRVPYPDPPYQTPLEKIRAHAEAPVPSVRAARPEVPEKLAALLGRLLAKDPASRPASADEVAEALRPFAAGSDLRKLARRLALPAEERVQADPGQTPPPTRLTGPRRRRPYLLAGVAAGLLALAALAGAVLYIETARGTLEVRTDDRDVHVSVDQDGEVVTVLDLKNRNEVELRAGKYHLRVEGRDDLVVPEGDTFDLRRGDRVVARIRRKGWDLLPTVALSPPPDPAALARRPGAADALRGEGIPADAPTALGKELVAVLGASLRHAAEVRALAVSPDGNTLASAGGFRDARDKPGEVCLWDARSGLLLHSLRGHIGPVPGVAFSPDGTRLASAGSDTVRLWDVATGQEVKRLEGSALGVAFSPDGKLLAAGRGEFRKSGEVNLWDPDSGKELFTFTGHTDVVARVAFSPDGKLLASAGWDQTVKVWDVEARRLAHTLRAPGPKRGPDWVPSMLDVAWSPDGRRLAGGSSDFTLRVWDLATEQEVIRQPHRLAVPGVAYSPDGTRLATVCWDGTVRLWDAQTGTPLTNPFLAHPPQRAVALPWAGAVAFFPDGWRLATGGADRRVRVWAADPSGPLRLVTYGHEGRVQALAVSPDGTLAASGGEDHTVRLWDLATRKPLAVLVGHDGPVRSVAFSPDGKLLASAGQDPRIRIWEVAARKDARTLLPLTGAVEAVAFHPAGKVLASSGADGTVTLWNVATAERVRALPHPRQATGLAFSPDGRALATGCDDGIVRLWDPATAVCRAELPGHHQVVNHVAFSPDGSRLASVGDDHTVRVWDVAASKEQRVLPGHAERVHDVAFSADGRHLASSSQDGTARVWDLGTEPPAAREFAVAPRGQWVHAAVFTPEGRHLLTANPDGTIFVLRLAPPPAAGATGRE